MAERHDRADVAVRRQAEHFADRGSDVRPDPGDPGAEPEHPGRDQNPLGDPPVVVGEADLMSVIDRQYDRDRRDCRVQGARLEPDLRDPADRLDLRDDDEPPRLGVAAAAGPAGDVRQRIERVAVDRLGGELADLSGAAQRSEDVMGESLTLGCYRVATAESTGRLMDRSTGLADRPSDVRGRDK